MEQNATPQSTPNASEADYGTEGAADPAVPGAGDSRLDANRLTEADRATILGRMTEVVDSWSTHRTAVRGDSLEALLRIGAGAIGCGLMDLRASELVELAAIGYVVIDQANDRTGSSPVDWPA